MLITVSDDPLKSAIIIGPDEDTLDQLNLLRSVMGTISHFFGSISNLFGEVHDLRNPQKIDYSVSCDLFTAMLMFLCRLGSRRETNYKFRGSSRVRAKFKALFGVDNVPHGDTLNEAFRQLDVDDVQEVICCMVEMLIRKKVLYPYRLLGQYFMIALDGTGVLTYHEKHCEHCLERKLRNGTTLYYHPVLEAKLVTSSGFVFSIMSEFIENDDPNADKQDCELKAFYRLAERLKARFPRLPVCLLLDGLFAGGPTFGLCDRYGWKYMITLKDKDLPTVNREFDSIMELEPENRTEFRMEQQNKKIHQTYHWVNDISYVDSNKKEHSVSVLECLETKANDKGNMETTKFKWITNFHLTAENVIILANSGGRLRWKIENEGFNTQKNGGFELEHAYTKNETAAKIFYLILQFAHNIFQLIEKGSLFRKAFPKGVGSLKNIADRILEAWRNLPVTTDAFLRMGEGNFQIRFDDTS